jgi:hypothetical protein
MSSIELTDENSSLVPDVQGLRPVHEPMRGVFAKEPRVRICVLLIVGLIVLQRLVVPIPGGSLPLALIWFVLLSLKACVTGMLELSVPRLLAFIAAIGGVLASVLLHNFVGIEDSLYSVILLASIYGVGVLSIKKFEQVEFIVVVTIFVRVMTAVAAIAVGMFLAQFVGWHYRDLLADVIPEAFLQEGYVTSYPISVGSNIFRSNGIVFLESSFCSLFLGVAVLCHLAISRRGVSTLLILVAGMATCLAGSGFVVLMIGVAASLYRRRKRPSIKSLTVLCVLALAILISPLGQTFVGRTGEFGREGSSASLRFVQPYDEYPRAIWDAPLLGHGAGSTTGFAEATGNPGLIATPPLKLSYEYGLVVAALFLVFLYGVFQRSPVIGLRSALAAQYFFINSALNQPVLALLSIFFLATMRVAEGSASGLSPQRGSMPALHLPSRVRPRMHQVKLS